MSFAPGFVIGMFLGFVFGVGCALAVMYSVFLGGYRAALRDADSAPPPPRLLKMRAQLAGRRSKPGQPRDETFL